MWLVLFGLAIHLVFFYSIFDIYFTSPLVHGMAPYATQSEAPAKRLVLFVADGLRADKFFELGDDEAPRAPYLRSIIEKRGSWGVSHTRVPTESRPGHVALIAGFYEDVSAVAKGWKENPVEFDSVFNESRYTWSWGSPDILPMFAKGATGSHVYTHYYTAEMEDFASTDSHKLDTWVFDRVKEFFKQAESSSTLKSKLTKDKIVFFLHLLGLDTCGHSRKPFSKDYIFNIKVVDEGVQGIENLIEDFYGHDEKTAYILSADHGMTDWGSHGAGDPSETLTPIVVWGAGVRSALPNTGQTQLHSDTFSKDWKLDHIRRHDIQQADVAALMSSLIGVPFPLNSVGRLPLEFLNASDWFKAESIFTNAQQILAQYQVKMKEKQESTLSLVFRPFKHLLESQQIEKLRDIRNYIQDGRYSQAIDESENLIDLALQGLNYYQTYDRLFLGFSIVCGFLGWMTYLLTLVLEGYSGVNFHVDKLDQLNTPVWRCKTTVTYTGLIVAGVITILLKVQLSPLSYYIYCLVPVALWTLTFLRLNIFFTVLSHINQSISLRSLILYTVGVFGATELVVWSFFQREFLSVGLVGMTVWLITSKSHGQQFINLGWFGSCLVLAVFPLLPVVGKDTDYKLVLLAGGIMVIASTFIINRLFKLPSAYKGDSVTNTKYLFIIQTILVGLSTYIVQSTASNIGQGSGLPIANQIFSWIILGFSLILPLLSSNMILERLFSVTLATASSVLLLSIRQESLFFLSLSVLLYFWVIREQSLTQSSVKLHHIAFQEGSIEDRRVLEWADLRRAYFFVFLILVAFFGTGNIASINSFEPASVYCFLTVFNPFLMGALMVWKNLLPFVLVTCWFSAVHVITNLPTRAFFLIVFIISDFLALHFFFLVRDYGSWLDIGTSISHYVIVMSMIIFVVILFGVGHVLTHWRLPRRGLKHHYR